MSPPRSAATTSAVDQRRPEGENDVAQVKSATPTKAAKVKAAKPKESTASWQARMTKCDQCPVWTVDPTKHTAKRHPAKRKAKS